MYLNKRRGFRELRSAWKWRRDVQHLEKFYNTLIELYEATFPFQYWFSWNALEFSKKKINSGYTTSSSKLPSANLKLCTCIAWNTLMISFWRSVLRLHKSSKSAANTVCFQCTPVVIGIPLLCNMLFGYHFSDKMDFVGLPEVWKFI